VGETKEDDERIPFHTLLTTGTHRRDRISRRKITVAVLFMAFWAAALLFVLAAASRLDRGRRAGAVLL
jgi:hypothetical protein